MKKPRKRIYKILLKTTFLILILTIASNSFAKYQFGNNIMAKYAEKMIQEKVDMVVFPHWIHTMWFKCKVCHNDPFILESGANDITMKEINEGKECGLCHNGTIAFSQKECKRCHSLSSDEAALTLKTDPMTKRLYPTIFTTKLTKGKEKKNKALKFADPKDVPISELKAIADKLGVQWDAKYFEENGFPRNRIKTIDYKKLVLREKLITPRGSLPGKEEKEQIRNNFIVFNVLSDFVDSIAFPHNTHSYLLNCDTCHEKVFTSELGSNLVHMREIADGKFCGYCHNKVSFPLAICTNCHKIPKGEKNMKDAIAKSYNGGDWTGDILVRKNPLKGKKLYVSTKRGEGLSIIGDKTKKEMKEDEVSALKVQEQIKAEKEKSALSLGQISKENKKEAAPKPSKTVIKSKQSVSSQESIAPSEKKPSLSSEDKKQLISVKKEDAPPPVQTAQQKTEETVAPAITTQPNKRKAETTEKSISIEKKEEAPKVKKGGCLLFSWFSTILTFN